MSSLDAKDREILSAAVLDTETWLSGTLANALKDRGIQISDKSIAKHRRGTCSC